MNNQPTTPLSDRETLARCRPCNWFGIGRRAGKCVHHRDRRLTDLPGVFTYPEARDVHDCPEGRKAEEG
jgi:hypothetical protein